MLIHHPFRCIRQRDAMQCGVAALAMVCRHFGLKIPVERLERLCTPTAEGVSLKGIADAASALGLQSAAAKVTPERLAELPLPCILHWNQNHFTVLYRSEKVRRNGFLLEGRSPDRRIEPHTARCIRNGTEVSEPPEVSIYMMTTPPFRRSGDRPSKRIKRC